MERRDVLMPNASAVILAFLFVAAFVTSCDDTQKTAGQAYRAVMVLD